MKGFRVFYQAFVVVFATYVSVAAAAAVQKGWRSLIEEGAPIFPPGELWESIWAGLTLVAVWRAAYVGLDYLRKAVRQQP